MNRTLFGLSISFLVLAFAALPGTGQNTKTREASESKYKVGHWIASTAVEENTL